MAVVGLGISSDDVWSWTSTTVGALPWVATAAVLGASGVIFAKLYPGRPSRER